MKILVAVLSSNVNHENLENILTEFEQKGYHVHTFDKAEEQVESMLDLPHIINYVKTIEEVVERIVILSNISEFIFSWYRCYPGLVDDFIYYLDEDTDLENMAIVHKIPQGDFYEQLYNFNGIEQEENLGKIYINIDLANFRKVSQFILVNNGVKFFDVYSNFQFHKDIQKSIVNKVYIYNELQYSFIIDENAVTEMVIIHPKTLCKKDILIHELCKLLKSQYHFIFYLLIIIKEMFANHPHCKAYLLGVSTQIKLDDDNAKDFLYQCFTDYCETDYVTFHDKIIVASLMVALGIKEKIYSKIMELLLTDNYHIESHYSLLTNTLCYHTANGISHYKKIFHDREQEMEKIINFYKENIIVDSMPMRKKNRILIHTTQLLDLRHSPTLLALNYAKYLKTYYPDYDIQIFVDDIFAYHSTENTFPYNLSSALSITCREIHEKFLKELGIIIYYSDPKKERRERIKEGLENIHGFGPELILGLSTDFSIIRGLLYGDYPIIDLTLGGLSNSHNADLFIHGYEQSYIEQECIKYDYNLENLRVGKFLKHISGVEFPDATTEVKRADYQFAPGDFIMVTVGNRLNSEMNEEFIDMICSFLKDKSNVKWVIIGKAELVYLKEKYPNLVKEQVVFIEYQFDLSAFYKICDVYINPFRKNGGYSAAMGMNQSLPVITLSMSDDVVAFTGKENSVLDIVEYLNEMKLIYEDEEYKKNKGNLLKRRLDEKFSFRCSIDEMVKFFHIAANQFNERQIQ